MTPFDKKAVMYRLVKKIRRERQPQSPWWLLFHVYFKGSIKPLYYEKFTMYYCCNMRGKDINHKGGNNGLITHIKARHEYKCLRFVADEKGGLKRPSASS